MVQAARANQKQPSIGETARNHVEAELNKVRNIKTWHEYNEDDTTRPLEAFQAVQDWIVKHTQSNSDINRDTLFNNGIQNLIALGPIINMHRAESLLAGRK